MVYQNDGDPINNAMFQIFATTKTGTNLDNCQPYRQTIGEGAPKDKFTLTVNNVKVNFADEYLDKSIKDIGLLDVESHIADNGALADPMWLNYYNINLASGTNTVVFETPASPGYSIYIGGFRVTF